MVIVKDETKKRTSKGRRKIQIKKIENVSSRQVTFSKRRFGLFKKASELCVLTGVQVAIIVHSHSNRTFSFGYPKPDAVIERYLLRGVEDCHVLPQPEFVRDYNLHYADVCRQLEVEKKRCWEECAAAGDGLWWCKDVEGRTPEELEEYGVALDKLRDNVTTRANEIHLVQNSLSFVTAPRNHHEEEAPPLMSTGVGSSLNNATTFVKKEFNNDDQYWSGFEFNPHVEAAPSMSTDFGSSLEDTTAGQFWGGFDFGQGFLK